MTTAFLTRDATTRRTEWQLDPAHTAVEFEAKHLMISKVRGRFATVSGTLVLDETDLARSEVAVEIDAASIDSRQPQRDAHLRSADFLEVERYPTLTFRGTRIERGPTGFRLSGDLTIRDVTREVALEVEEEGRVRDPEGNERIVFRATTAIDRREFGLTWNLALEAGGVLVGNEVKIFLEVQAVRLG
jgi:polyisoprenoid-binding protein YceI